MAEPRPPESKQEPKSTTAVAPPIGTMVLVRSTISSLVPAVVTNDFEGQNTAGALSLIAFNSASFDNNPLKVVQSAQAETFEVPAEDLARELFMWWQPMGSSLAKRDLQKEIDNKREKPAQAEPKPAEVKV